MIYSILCLFALSSLSTGNRRLLQAVPPILPAVVQPVVPAVPATPVQPEYVPVHPVDPQPGVPATPTQPAHPITPVTLPPLNIPPFVPSVPAPLSLLCSLPYTAPTGSCAGQINKITNAAERFSITCNGYGSCAQSRITLSYLAGGPFIESIEKVIFSEGYAGYMATLTIDNQQGSNKVVLEEVVCAKETSCNGLTIILVNAHLNDMKCDSQNDCQDCWVKQHGPLDPNPKRCYGW